MVGAHVRRTAPELLVPDGILFTVLAFFSLHVWSHSGLNGYPVLNTKG
jgi:hypothetical protein